jgi:hypothetical protein
MRFPLALCAAPTYAKPALASRRNALLGNLSSIRNKGADLDLLVPVELMQHYVDEGLPLDAFSTEAYRRAQQMSEGVAAKQQALRLLEEKCIAWRQAAGAEPPDASAAQSSSATMPAADAAAMDRSTDMAADAGAAGGKKRKR